MICKPREYFQCSSSQCIPWSEVCDGVVNCENKSDEVCGKSHFIIILFYVNF